MPDAAKTFMIEDARLIFLNFSGKEGPYNRQGERNFAAILTPELAETMLKDGWNVRYLAAREEGDEETPYIQIGVRFDVFPPRIVLISGSTRTQLTESNVEVLDWADIRLVDLIARGHDWNVGDKSGTKAYLQTMFVTIQKNPLEQKYDTTDDIDS